MEQLAPAAPVTADAENNWHAAIHLGYERDGARTVLSRRTHRGPLVVQKSLYPEGESVCQTIIVHPPAGVVGGDRLRVDVDLGADAHAQVTTPGAAKWYRSTGRIAWQDIALRAAAGATLEWLPQETIVFDGAIGELALDIELLGDATFMGWDIVCLGRAASGERFERGRLRQRISLARDGVPLFIERADLTGGDALLDSPVGLNGAVVFGTFVATAQTLSDAILALCRDVTAQDGEVAVTRVHGCLLGRYRGASTQSARAYFARLWCVLRPPLTGRSAVLPRIWNT
jgi:urease accessory protein